MTVKTAKLRIITFFEYGYYLSDKVSYKSIIYIYIILVGIHNSTNYLNTIISY